MTAWTRRGSDHPLAAPLLLIATHASGRTAEALATAAAAAAGPASSRRTSARLARLALALEAPEVAARLLDSHPPIASDARDLALRGELALALGEYTAARTYLLQAGRLERRMRWSGMVTKVKAELALLDPAWRPRLPASSTRPLPTRARPAPGRILHLLTNSLPYRPSGYGVRAQHVALCQRDVGLDPEMVTRAGFPGNEGTTGVGASDTIDGVTYHRLSPGLEPGLTIERIAQATAAGLLDLVAQRRPVLLQPTTNYVNAQIALAVGEAAGLPVVYEVRGFLEQTWISQMGEGAESSERYTAVRAIETACMRRATGIVTLSETMRADILERGGIDPERVAVIPNGVDVDRFVPGRRDEALAAKLGIAATDTVVGYISSFVRYEGIGYLIEAAARLRQRGRKVVLLLVGDGAARSDLEAIAARTGLDRDGGVIFTGRVPHVEVERYYRTIDIFVVPRTNDRVSRLVTPLKPFEAMAMAKALVVSAVPALLEIVREDETGRSFPAEDPAALADAIEALVDDPAARRRMGEAARAWVSDHRTWAHNGQRYLELYQRLGVV